MLLTQLIHENFSLLMCFIYSRQPLEKMIETRFSGGWKYLRKAIFDISEVRAYRACLELALFLRVLDDEGGISEFQKGKYAPDCGRLIMSDGSKKTLTIREFSNKVIHASKLDWDLGDDSSPTLICHNRDKNGWIRAEVNIIGVAAVCGALIS